MVSVGVQITNANIAPLIPTQTREKLWDSVAPGAYMNYPENCLARMLFASEKAEDGHSLA